MVVLFRGDKMLPGAPGEGPRGRKVALSVRKTSDNDISGHFVGGTTLRVPGAHRAVPPRRNGRETTSDVPRMLEIATFHCPGASWAGPGCREPQGPTRPLWELLGEATESLNLRSATVPPRDQPATQRRHCPSTHAPPSLKPRFCLRIRSPTACRDRPGDGN